MTIELKPSRILSIYLAILHLVAMIIIAMLPVAISYKIMGLVLLIASVSYYFSNWFRQWKNLACRLEKNEQACWTISYTNGQQSQHLKLVKSIVTTNLVLLYLLEEGKLVATPVLLVSDMMNADAMRKLRIYLRHTVKAE